MERRWRQVQVIDEGWQYEEQDASFIANPDEAYDVDGWRPVGFVWNWALPSLSDRPWRGSIGPLTNRDYVSLDNAKLFTERRTASAVH